MGRVRQFFDKLLGREGDEPAEPEPKPEPGPEPDPQHELSERRQEHLKRLKEEHPVKWPDSSDQAKDEGNSQERETTREGDSQSARSEKRE